MARCAGRLPSGARLLMAIGFQMAALPSGRCESATCPVVRTPPPGTLPFDASQLLRLIRLRLPDTTRCACPSVDVSPGEAPGVVIVACPDRRAEVSLGDRTGEEAAREVAIVLADILLAPAPRPQPVRAMPTEVVAAGPATTEPSRWSFWGAPSVAWGTNAGAAFEPHVGVGRSLAGPLGWLVDIGFAKLSATAPKSTQSVGVEMVPLRAGGALTLGPWRLSAGAVVRGFRANAGNADLGARFGGFVAADWVLRRWSPLHPYLTAGLDVYTQTLDVRLDGISTLTGDHLAPSIALGVLWSRVRP